MPTDTLTLLLVLYCRPNQQNPGQTFWIHQASTPCFDISTLINIGLDRKSKRSTYDRFLQPKCLPTSTITVTMLKRATCHILPTCFLRNMPSHLPYPFATPKLYLNFLFWYSFYLHLFSISWLQLFRQILPNSASTFLPFYFYSFDYTVKSGGVCNRLPYPSKTTLSRQRITMFQLRIGLPFHLITYPFFVYI